jgi:hypothetical protein
MKIKDELHHLIDTIDDEQLLKSYYQLIQSININSGGKLWSALNELEKQELLLGYDESFDQKNLLSHQQVKRQHEKWLKP